jgi:serine/threonine-protein kinase RsbW
MGQQISFTSKAENLNQVEVLINTVCKDYEVNEDYYGNILIALTEAVNNAIHHGNKSNPNKTVTLGFYAENSILKFTVEDEGPGFDYQNLPDPTDPKLADEIDFASEGAIVTMSFNLEDELLQEVQKEKEEEKRA